MKMFFILSFVFVALFYGTVSCNDDRTEYYLSGKEITLKCGVLEEDSKEVSWMHKVPDKAVVEVSEDNEAYELDFEKSNDLTIKKFTHELGGTYKCVNLDDEDEEYSTHEIAMKKSIVINPMKDLTLGKGDTKTITCRVSVGMPVPRVVWTRKDGKSIDKITNKDGSFSKSTLKFKNFSEEDAGDYICTATNRAGDSSKSEIHIGYTDGKIGQPKEMVKPQIVTTKFETSNFTQYFIKPNQKYQVCVSGVIGKPLELNVNFIAFPRPKLINWKFIGGTIEFGKHPEMYSMAIEDVNEDKSEYKGTLKINKFKTENVGTYTAGISNEIGDTTANIQVLNGKFCPPEVYLFNKKNPKRVTVKWYIQSNRKPKQFEVKFFEGSVSAAESEPSLHRTVQSDDIEKKEFGGLTFYFAEITENELEQKDYTMEISADGGSAATQSLSFRDSKPKSEKSVSKNDDKEPTGSSTKVISSMISVFVSLILLCPSL